MSCPICQKDHAYSTSEALARLASAPGRLQRLVESLGSRKVAVRPAPDKWSVKEVVYHLSDCEMVYGFRYRKILAEPETSLVAFDQNRWADSLRYGALPLKPALASFTAMRGHHLSMLKALPAEAWDGAAQHPEYGALSLRQLVAHLAEHDRNHIAQIERLVAALAPSVRKKKKRPAARKRAQR